MVEVAKVGCHGEMEGVVDVGLTAASTTATMASRTKFRWTNVSAKNVCATGPTFLVVVLVALFLVVVVCV